MSYFPRTYFPFGAWPLADPTPPPMPAPAPAAAPGTPLDRVLARLMPHDVLFHDGGSVHPAAGGAAVGGEFACQASWYLVSATFCCPRPVAASAVPGSQAAKAGIGQPWRAIVQVQPAGTAGAAAAIDVAALDLDLAAVAAAGFSAPIPLATPVPLAPGDVVRCGVLSRPGATVALDAPSFTVGLRAG